MFPVAEVLVFFLYVLLIQEIIEIFFFGPKVKDKPNYSNRTGGGSTNYQRRSVTSAAFRIHHGSAVIRIRAPILTITKSKIERVKAHSHPIEKHKSINSLDGLWRRMRQATENYRLFHKKDAMITEVMAAARKEAYDAMVKKNSEEKQKILKTNSEAEKD